MADQWYTQRDGQKYGPFSPAQLKQMTVSGQLLPVDLVSKSADGRWVAASRIKGLFAASVVTPPPTAPANAFEFSQGPPPAPATAPSGRSVGVVDREATPADPAAVVVGRLLGAKGLPPKIAVPVLGMLAVFGSTLALSLFGVMQAVADRHDLRFHLLTAFALSHSVLGVVATALTARLRYSVAAPAAAILAATAFGWYVFASGWTIVWVLGLMAGVPLGAWALWTFRSPDVKALFADGDKPGPLDRLGTPALAGVAGLMLAAILAVGGVLHTVARDKSGGNATSSGGSYQSGSQSKSRNSGNKRTGKTYLDDVVAESGPPTASYAKKDHSDIAEYSLHVWEAGSDSFDLVFTALPTKINEPEFVQGRESDVDKARLDAILRNYRRK